MPGVVHSLPMISGGVDMDGKWRDEIVARLRALQQALDASHSEMAKHAHCGMKSWDAFVNGRQDFPPDCALALEKRLGIDMKWFYTGDASRNKPDLQARIDEAERNPQKPRRGRKIKKRPSP